VPKEFCEPGELQMAVFKTFSKSKGLLVKLAGGIPDPAHGGKVAGMWKMPKSSTPLNHLMCIEIKV